jgi:hypothetical protein
MKRRRPSHWPAGHLTAMALAILVIVAARYCTGCAEALPWLTAAATAAPAAVDAYNKTLEAARAKGATESELAEIRAALDELLRLEREQAKCRATIAAVTAPATDPGAVAKALHDQAVADEQRALAHDIAAELLRRIDERAKPQAPTSKENP